MNKTNIIIVSLIVAIVSLNFLLKPYLRDREAKQFVESILTDWQDGNISIVMSHWANHTVNTIPPIDNILSYSIEDIQHYKKDKSRYTDVTIFLELAPNRTFPSGSKWKFRLKKTTFGLQIYEFNILR